jgi:hypothetical protein
MRLCPDAAARLRLAAAFPGSLVLALALLGGCGRGGDGGGGGGGEDEPPGEQPPPDDDGLGLRTNVGLDPLSYRLDLLTSCLKRTGLTEIPVLGADFVADGGLADWAKQPILLDDPVDDAPARGDLAATMVARHGEDVVLATALAPSAGIAVDLEWGGVVARKGELAREIRHLVSWQRDRGDQLVDHRDDGAHALSADAVVVAGGSGGTELTFKRSFVGDVTSWPLWWVRVQTRDVATGRLLDSTAAVYFPGLIGNDAAPFELSVCREWTGRKLPVSLLQIRDADSAADGFPIGNAGERAFQLARFAIDAVQAAWGFEGDGVPAAQVVVLATANAVPAVTIPASARPLVVDALPYLGTALDGRALGPEAVEAFPQGAAIERVASGLLDEALLTAFPTAPWAIRRAWRNAQVDAIVRRSIGDAYWFDYYGGRVQPFLEKSDQAAPVALASVGSDAVAAAKADAFGHLLAASFDARLLVTAWRRAAQSCGASASCDVARALLVALRMELGEDDVGLAAAARLWPGWMTAAAYDGEATPATLRDADFDGVPDFVEIARGTDSRSTDTDEDGWSDLAEIVKGTDPGVMSSAPEEIVPDQGFGDWQKLLPRRLNMDRTHAGLCPKAADIEYYAAVADTDHVVIGAVAAEFWEAEGNARWEAVVDFPAEDRQLLLEAVSGERVIRLKHPRTGAVLKELSRAAPVARRTVEWALSRQDLGFKEAFDQADAVRVRLRTVYLDPAAAPEDADGRFCDETSWFSPFIYQ